MIKEFFTLIQVLPEILKLIQVVQDKIDEDQTNRKVANDLKAIHEAFASKDAAKLNAIFNATE